MRLVSFIHLYRMKTESPLDLERIARYLRKKLEGIEVDLRRDCSEEALSKLSSPGKGELLELLIDKFARAKVTDLRNKGAPFEPLPAEVEYERNYLRGSSSQSTGILYDGFKLISINATLVPEEERNFRHCHIILSDRLFGTWEENEKRFHARVSIYGFPSIISTSGIVEAPAKPREFYLKRRLGIDPLVLKEEFRERFIDYDDERLTEVIKGYVMQAIFFQATGEPFCEDKGCRLYNAHWQEEVIQAQIKSDYEFCPRHLLLLGQIEKKTNPVLP